MWDDMETHGPTRSSFPRHQTHFRAKIGLQADVPLRTYFPARCKLLIAWPNPQEFPLDEAFPSIFTWRAEYIGQG